MIRVSATQIELYQNCPRKWAYSRCRPRVQSPWQAFGTRMHKILELWLSLGIVPDLDETWSYTDERGVTHVLYPGAAAFEGLPLLPAPPQSGVEFAFAIEFFGVVYVGAIDLLSAYVPRQRVLVTDHKSTVDLKYAKTREELSRDPQWIIYGTVAAELLDVPTVGGQWAYYRRKPPKAMDSTIVESRETLRTKFEEQHRRVVLPLVASRALMPDDPMMRELWIATHARCPNAGARDSFCSKYKGCEFRGECLGVAGGLAAIAA